MTYSEPARTTTRRIPRILVAGGPRNVAVEHGDVVGVDARQLKRGVAVTGDVRRDRLQAQAIADGLCQKGFVLNEQHTHAPMLGAGAYRRHIENPIRAGNPTLP